MADEDRTPKAKLYPCDPDLDPQLVWRGNDEQVAAKAIIDDLKRLKQTNGQPQGPSPTAFRGGGG